MGKVFAIKLLIYIAAFLLITIGCAIITKLTGWEMRFLNGWFCCMAWYAIEDYRIEP